MAAGQGVPSLDRPLRNNPPSRAVLVCFLGIGQIFAWGSTFYLPAVAARAITADLNIALSSATGGLCAGLLVAGLVSPRVGSVINERGGRPVLAASSVLLGLGLTCLGLARGPWTYIAAWLVAGAGMGAGLYDAAFATLGRIYGRDARDAISALTLVAGFSSTICWPLSSYLLDHIGWQNTCFFYAVVQLTFSLPLHLLVLPSSPAAAKQPHAVPAGSRPSPAPGQRHIFLVLAAAFTIAGVISAIMSVHILSMLQDLGTARNTSVTIGALIGPSQVGSRLLDLLLGRSYHPIWTLAASAALTAAGLALLLVAPTLGPLAIILYGAGTGIGWIARGTVPLALFGPENYAALMGRLALPSTVSVALAPFLGALLVERAGARPTLGILAAVAGLNLIFVAELFRRTTKARSASLES